MYAPYGRGLKTNVDPNLNPADWRCRHVQSNASGAGDAAGPTDVNYVLDAAVRVSSKMVVLVDLLLLVSLVTYSVKLSLLYSLRLILLARLSSDRCASCALPTGASGGFCRGL